jgi:hypothetical protein
MLEMTKLADKLSNSDLDIEHNIFIPNKIKVIKDVPKSVRNRKNRSDTLGNLSFSNQIVI